MESFGKIELTFGLRRVAASVVPLAQHAKIVSWRSPAMILVCFQKREIKGWRRTMRRWCGEIERAGEFAWGDGLEQVPLPGQGPGFGECATHAGCGPSH
jgi:hypothetical protein